MSRQLLPLSVELFWLLLIAAFSFLCVLPLDGVIARIFLQVNFFMAALLVFYFRAVLFFRQVFYLKILAVQILFFIGNIVLFFMVLGKAQDMFFQFDTNDITWFLAPGNEATAIDVLKWFQFYRNEFTLFSVGILILLVLLELRIVAAFIQRIKKIE